MLDPDIPARLFRNFGYRDAPSIEQIGDGTLAKMIRIALSDPDGELWRYSITTDARRFVGKEIKALAAKP